MVPRHDLRPPVERATRRKALELDVLPGLGDVAVVLRAAVAILAFLRLVCVRRHGDGMRGADICLVPVCVVGSDSGVRTVPRLRLRKLIVCGCGFGEKRLPGDLAGVGGERHIYCGRRYHRKFSRAALVS